MMRYPRLIWILIAMKNDKNTLLAEPAIGIKNI